MNGTLFFSADDGVNGRELWKTDGTTATRVNIGTGGSYPTDLTAMGSTLFFSGDDGTNGRELWKSDTSGVVTMMANINKSGDSHSSSLTVVGSTLFFTADNGTNGRELWKTDGVPANTAMVLDINATGSNSSDPSNLTVVGSKLFFTADNGTNGRELWTSDGTAKNTAIVKDINTNGTDGSDPSSLTVFGSTVFFTAFNNSSGRELWSSDGTSANTKMVMEINTNNSNADSSDPDSLTVFGSTLYFSAWSATSGRELWKTNGTTTALVQDINTSGDSSPDQLTVVGSTLFFRADDGKNGQELWKTDGSTTAMVKDINKDSSDVDRLTNFNGTLYFTAHSNVKSNELWKSDGTGVGTTVVADGNAAGPFTAPYELVNVNGTLFYTAWVGDTGYELWKSDGTSLGTVMVKDIAPGGDWSYPTELINFNGTLYFVADDGANGTELWKSDGSEAGTKMVMDIRSGGGHSDPQNLTVAGSVLYFTANDGTNGRELWKTDGTTTTMVKNIASGSNGSYPNYLTDVNGTLFFSANDGGAYGRELWRSDSKDGAVLVKDLNTGSYSGYGYFSDPDNLTNVNGTLFFTASDTSGLQLWKSDGTDTGTKIVKDLTNHQYAPNGMANVNGTLFFGVQFSGGNMELWKSDGTTNTLVKEIGEGSSSEFMDMTVLNSKLFFTANDGINGRELWTSDGTAANTKVVKEINLTGDSTSNNPNDSNDMIVFNGVLVFSANDGINGYELWQSDGTSAGTTMVPNINPGAASSYAYYFTDVNGTLFFTADDGVHSQELWKATGLGNSPPVITSNGGSATASTSIAENTTAVTTVTATDADAGTTLTYSISGGADSAKFSIDKTSGALTFSSAPDFDIPADSGKNNVYDVTVQVSDGAATDTQAIAVTITNVNEDPDITSGTTFSVAENTTTVTTIAASDPDAGTTLTFTITAGADMAKFSIDKNSGALTFNSAPDFENPDDGGKNNIYDLTVQVSDGSKTDSQAIAVTVTNVNEDPTITSNSGGATASISFSENGTSVTTVTANDPDAGTTLTYSVTGGADMAKFSVDKNSGVLTFNSAPDFEIPGDTGKDNIYDVTVQVSDGSKTDSQAIAITVTNVNEDPDITSGGTFSVAENNTAVTTVAATDPDAGTTLTFSITAGADMAKFSIDKNSGALTFNSAPDFEIPGDTGKDNIYDLTVQVSDGSKTDSQAIAVTVTNVNEDPTITSNSGGATASISFSENGTSVTTVTANDPDAGTTLTYSVIGGADSVKFSVDKTSGLLTFNSAPDFETPDDSGKDNVYDVTVQVSDGSKTDSQAIAVTVTNVNEDPIITSNSGGPTASINFPENGTTVTANDPDAGTTLTYSITGGADSGKFSIDKNSGLLTFNSAPDFETLDDSGKNNIYDVTVQVSDGAKTDSQAIAITVTNVNEVPAITSNGGGATASINFPENGTAVTTVTANDPDAGTTLTYSITGGADSAKLSIDKNTGALTFNSAPDFETPDDSGKNNVYDVTVQVTDGSLTDSQDIAVTVTNLNEPPSITSDGGLATAGISTFENSKAVTTATAIDPDAGTTLTFSILPGGDGASFTIDKSTGALTFTSAPNYENPLDAGKNNVYDVTIQVSDGSLTDTQAIAVTVNNLNEEPTGKNNTVSLLEDKSYTFKDADFGFQDLLDTPANAFAAVKITTVSLTNGGTFQNNGVTIAANDLIPIADITGGKVVFTPDADEHGTAYASFTFQVQDNGSTANPGDVNLDQSANSMTISVTSVNDEPSFTETSSADAISTTHLLEDSGTYTSKSQVITTIAADGSAPGDTTETGQTFTYHVDIVSAPTHFSSLFTSATLTDQGSGKLGFALAPNAYGTMTFTLHITDSGGTANGGDNSFAAASPTTYTLTVDPVADAPTITVAQQHEHTMSPDGEIFIQPFAQDYDSYNPPGSPIAFNYTPLTGTPYYRITNITGGVLYYNDAQVGSEIANSAIIKVGDGNGGGSGVVGSIGGLRFLPDPNSYNELGHVFGFDIQPLVDGGTGVFPAGDGPITHVNIPVTRVHDAVSDVRIEAQTLDVTPGQRFFASVSYQNSSNTASFPQSLKVYRSYNGVGTTPGTFGSRDKLLFSTVIPGVAANHGVVIPVSWIADVDDADAPNSSNVRNNDGTGSSYLIAILDEEHRTGDVDGNNNWASTVDPVYTVTVPTITITRTTNATEGVPDSGQFVFTRSGDTSRALTVYVQWNSPVVLTTSNLSSPADFTGGVYPGSPSPYTMVQFLAGFSTAVLKVTPVIDTNTQASEAATENLYATVIPDPAAVDSYITGGGASAPAEDVITITDVINTITIKATDATASETKTATATFRVARGSKESSKLPVTVTVDLAGGTGIATLGTDYLVKLAQGNVTLTPSGTTIAVTIPAKRTFVDFKIVPIDDIAREGVELINAAILPDPLSNQAYAPALSLTSASATLADNDDFQLRASVSSEPVSFTTTKQNSTSVRITVSVTNLGTNPAPGSILQVGLVPLSSSPTPSGTEYDAAIIPLQSFNVRALGAGASFAKTFSVRLSKTGPLAPGVYRIAAKADVGNAVAEANETDNYAFTGGIIVVS